MNCQIRGLTSIRKGLRKDDTPFLVSSDSIKASENVSGGVSGENIKSPREAIFTNPEGSQSEGVQIMPIRRGSVLPIRRGLVLPIRRSPNFANPEGSSFANPEGSQFANPEGYYFCKSGGVLFCQSEGYCLSRLKKTTKKRK